MYLFCDIFLTQIEIPRAYKQQFRQVLEADAKIVNLFSLSAYFYQFGMYILVFAGAERREMFESILKVLIHIEFFK